MRTTGCAVPGCHRKRSGADPRAIYCVSHHHRRFRYGAPTGAPVRPFELAMFRNDVDKGLARYAESEPVKFGMKLAQGVLNYRPSHGWKVQLEIQRRMEILNANGIGPRELLARVAEFYAFIDSQPYRLKTEREHSFALARAVLCLANLKSWRPTARLLSWLGDYLKEELSAWALMFVRRLDRDAKAKGEMMRKACDWSAVP